MKNIINIINEEINELHQSVIDYKKLGRQRMSTAKREVKVIHPDLDIQMASQGREWVQYWLTDKRYDEPLVVFSNENMNYIGTYEEEDFNKMIDYFKKRGQHYIENDRKELPPSKQQQYLSDKTNNLIKEVVSMNRTFFIETTDDWLDMLRKVKTENNIDKVSIVGKDDDLSIQLDRKGHKPMNLGKIVRKHLRNEQYQQNVIQHILKHAPTADPYFQPKEKRVRRLPPTASIEDKITMWDLVGQKANHFANSRARRDDSFYELIHMKYGNYWNELYDEIKDTPEFEKYREENSIARDINFGDTLA